LSATSQTFPIDKVQKISRRYLYHAGDKPLIKTTVIHY